MEQICGLTLVYSTVLLQCVPNHLLIKYNKGQTVEKKNTLVNSTVPLNESKTAL